MSRKPLRPTAKRKSKEKQPLEFVIPVKFKSIGPDEKKLCIFVEDVVDGEGPDLVETVHDEAKLGESIKHTVLGLLASALEDDWGQDSIMKDDGDGCLVDLQFTFKRLTQEEIDKLPER